MPWVPIYFDAMFLILFLLFFCVHRPKNLDTCPEVQPMIIEETQTNPGLGDLLEAEDCLEKECVIDSGNEDTEMELVESRIDTGRIQVCSYVFSLI